MDTRAENIGTYRSIASTTEKLNIDNRRVAKIVDILSSCTTVRILSIKESLFFCFCFLHSMSLSFSFVASIKIIQISERRVKFQF